MNTARFLKYVWPFYKMMHERVHKAKLEQKNTGNAGAYFKDL